jgi:hypothetical protein
MGKRHHNDAGRRIDNAVDREIHLARAMSEHRSRTEA